ncbi:response regulator transcription factor [Shewanella sp. 1_MG-2023]|uniref:Response regulator transcription factor n=1 Tax=Shewanella electrodiphila TaxID=934143 RepID=A0ABT0KNF6_9GAMM|nr:MULTISPECIES: response regulator transcription factor [Shewanella]MCC4831944.1 response regulator transcription factor [Shewanella sp. 10N.7]MCL1045071.1 response regulator transcription factor [Shewanella electrodiphila]MDO6612383.1 response regulator transcription factor [Shewanella sp. 7_MG-2023]MDO6772237.1 response regulator transcription factor [Shewanella sp. 2_MG-2023]MDO6794143.1 response regulator transcription factor [Shewanella sp. 1_MG-2023]
MKKILLIDQQLTHSLALCQDMESLGYSIEIVDNAFNALVEIERNDFEVILLDYFVPKMDSFWLLMAKHCQTPVIVLANNNDDVERMQAYELGADDYIAAPYNVKELLLRVNVLRRRSDKVIHQSDFDDVLFDDVSNTVTLNTQHLKLTQTEYRLFKYLFQRKGEVVTKAELQMRVLHKELGEFDRNLDMHISNTRRKMAKKCLPRELINTVRGKGYCFSSSLI